MKLAIVTSYFNPCGYRGLRENYYQFVKSLGEHSQRLLCSELVLDDDEPLDCTRVRISARGKRPDHFLWQKERLLNAGWQALPHEYDAVAWVDADIVFPDDSWVEQAERALEKHRVVQLFQDVHCLGPKGDVMMKRSGVAAVRRSGTNSQGAWGMAWAARRDDVSLPDFFVAGGGDVYTGKAFLGDGLRSVGNAKDFERAYVAWAAKQACRRLADVSFLPLRIEHLFHGYRQQRRYFYRDTILQERRFDPGRDVIPDGATYRWADPSSPVARDVQAWFAGRREDADRQAQAVC